MQRNDGYQFVALRSARRARSSRKPGSASPKSPRDANSRTTRRCNSSVTSSQSLHRAKASSSPSTSSVTRRDPASAFSYARCVSGARRNAFSRVSIKRRIASPGSPGRFDALVSWSPPGTDSVHWRRADVRRAFFRLSSSARASACCNCVSTLSSGSASEGESLSESVLADGSSAESFTKATTLCEMRLFQADKIVNSISRWTILPLSYSACSMRPEVSSYIPPRSRKMRCKMLSSCILYSARVRSSSISLPTKMSLPRSGGIPSLS
mmetsp:Transcript_9470/g.31423  ORF Transcript_9470/g.31423 Transcript_9470/m.31423 type:complete len:267 (-) Transcript_9470:687-1487(-)